MGLLDGKVALVTGSGSGIGQAVAVMFAKEGAKLIVDYIGQSAGAETTLKQVKDAGSDGIAVEADITKTADIHKLVDAAYAAFGELSVLVNNAGMEKEAPFTEVKEEDYDKVLAVNLRAPFFLTQYFVQKLQAAKKPGTVINMSSVHEDMVFPGFASYCISKGGLRMFMRDLSVELGASGITVNNIAPGAVATPINDNLMANKVEMSALLNNIPLHRMGQPEEIANLAAFLASEKASYITGATYTIDGGLMRSYHEQ